MGNNLNVPVKIKRLRSQAKLPAYATEGAAAMDLCAVLEAPFTLAPGQRALLSTGFAIELPGPEYVALIFARSSLGSKHGVALPNGVGVIDSDYRGEVHVALANHGQQPYVIQPGERVAQMAVVPVARAVLQEVDELDGTARGEGGFGSTGKL